MCEERYATAQSSVSGFTAVSSDISDHVRYRAKTQVTALSASQYATLCPGSCPFDSRFRLARARSGIAPPMARDWTPGRENELPAGLT